jgi:hypothetical protein
VDTRRTSVRDLHPTRKDPSVPSTLSFLVRRPAFAIAALYLTAVALAATAVSVADAAVTPRRESGRHAEPSPPATRVDHANRAFVARRYAEAYGLFTGLADEGHAPSAWMALLMVTNGPTLFGSEWSATASQLQRWRVLAEQYAERRSAAIPLHERGE